jgi:2,4-dienoyl-CoA reductase-like NADH-dependent reductase (Old Yellow Enzyme family)
MQRKSYKIFSQGKIGKLTLPNRLVRSATWDPWILYDRKMKDEVVNLYDEVAAGGVGLIITGDFSVIPKGIFKGENINDIPISYEQMNIEGFDRLADVVHKKSPKCKIFAQLSSGYQNYAPSNVPSPFRMSSLQPFTEKQVEALIECHVHAIAGVKKNGFDGAQLHAAHGSILSRFLSPYMNRRNDAFGGSLEKRTKIIREIVTGARKVVRDFPIIIKVNCTDYLKGGTDIDNFPPLAEKIEKAGFDAVEISGGFWDCLFRSTEELGFHPVPAPESHTRINHPDKQSYFLPYAEKLKLNIPVILVGGNRDIERLERIINESPVDFIALCRPLISEPDLPKRWLEGEGGSGTDCISCNACIYDMRAKVSKGKPWKATCLVKHDKESVKIAYRWLSSWVKKNIVQQYKNYGEDGS